MQKKYPIKILGGLILGVYIPIYPRRYAPGRDRVKVRVKVRVRVTEV